MITFSDSPNIAGLSLESQWLGIRLKYGVKLINDKAETVFNYVGLENVESWTGRLIQNGNSSNSGEEENAATGNRFYPGNILFGKLRPYLAKVFVAEEYGCCTSELLVFCPLKYNSNYLKYLILTPDFVDLVNSSTYGAKMPRASWDFIGNIFLPTPPLETQKLIARFLDRKTAAIDTLIAKKQRLIQLLEEKRTALINQAVTKGLNPIAPMKDSGIPWIGEIPEHWEVVHLKRAIASSDYGISNQLEPIGKYPVLRMGNLQNGGVVMDSVKYVDDVDPLLILKSNDILFNRTNSLDLVGKVALFREDPDVEVTFASYLVRFRSNALAMPDYLVLFLGRQDVQKIARAMALPAIGQVNLNPNRYGYLQICLPPCSEQIEIIAWLREKMIKIQELINKNNNQIEKLQEYRRSLITAAVTGKLAISEVEPDV
jgi:type I restriction enzyme, S subunit